MAREFTRTRRRRTHWTSLNSTLVTVTATQSTLLASAAGSHEGETIVRVRGFLRATLDSADAVTSGFLCAYGLGVVSSAAAAVGVGSIPTPLTDASWDGWLLHRFFSCRFGVAAISDGSGDVMLELDSKAMRKITEEETLVMVAEFIETGTAQLTIESRVRVLSMTN